MPGDFARFPAAILQPLMSMVCGRRFPCSSFALFPKRHLLHDHKFMCVMVLLISVSENCLGYLEVAMLLVVEWCCFTVLCDFPSALHIHEFVRFSRGEVDMMMETRGTGDPL